MKKIILVAGIATLAACSQPDTPTEAEPTEEAAQTAENIAADGLPSVGMYKVTHPDGSVTMADVREDGTYVSTDADGNVIETGKWEQKSPELYCETSDEEGAAQICYEESIDENGVYISKNPVTGETSTVERVPAEG